MSKSLKDAEALRDEMKLAYETVLNNPDTKYDQATIVYAKRCYDDAEALLQKINNELEKE